MQKKHIVLAAALATAFIVHACVLPTIEIKTGKLKVGVPTRVKSFSIAKIFSNKLASAFPEGFEIYDMVNYKDSQAFLVAYKMPFLDSINPDDYLDELKKQLNRVDEFNFGGMDIPSTSMQIPKLTQDEPPKTLAWFGMSSFFEEVRTHINTYSMEIFHTTLPNIGMDDVTLPVDQYVGKAPSFMTLKKDDGTSNFEWISVADGHIELKIELTGGTGINSKPPPGLSLTLPSINLVTDKPVTDGEDRFLNERDAGTTIEVTSAAPAIVSIEFKPDARIESDYAPRLEFDPGNIELHYDWSPDERTIDFGIAVYPNISDIALQGASKLKIGTIRPNFEEVANAIKIPQNFPPNFLNAKIGKGDLTLEAELPPPYNEEPADKKQTYCKGVKIGYELYIDQDPAPGGPFPGLSNLDGTTPWKIQDDITNIKSTKDLDGLSISNQEITLVKKDESNPTTEYCQITISAADPSEGIDFELFDDDIYDKDPLNDEKKIGALRNTSLPVYFSVDMQINEIEVVRWRRFSEVDGTSILPVIAPLEIDFGNIGGDDMSKLIRSIKFDNITLDIDFTTLSGDCGLPSELNDHIAIRVSCEELGFWDNNGGLDQVLHTEEPKLYSNQIASKPKEFFLKADPQGKAKVVTVDVQILPVIDVDGKPTAQDVEYIEIGPLIWPDDGSDIEMEMHAKANIDFEWAEARIDMGQVLQESGADTGMMKGSYPEDQKDYINLYEQLSPYMSGVTLSDKIETRLYVNSPVASLLKSFDNHDTPDGKLNLTVTAEYQYLDDSENWRPGTPIPLFTSLPSNSIPDYQIMQTGPLPQLVTEKEKKDGIYKGTSLPGGGTDVPPDFNQILARMPKDLRFNYEIELPREPFVVRPSKPGKPGTFDGLEDSKIEALVAIMIPLEFQVVPEGGGFNVSNEDFGGMTDIFGRGDLSDPIFAENLNVSLLKLKIDFQKGFFKNAYLHLDSQEEPADRFFGADGLPMTEGESITINLTPGYMAKAYARLIKPDIKIIFPGGSTLAIPKNYVPTSITVLAGGSYKLDLNEFMQD